MGAVGGAWLHRGVTDAAPYRLVRPPPLPVAPVQLDDAQRAVVEHRGGPLRVLAGPGTGKTATLVEAAAARIAAGADPESILVLTFSRRAAAELRVRIAARVGVTIREPLTRTFHSYAYGLLRRQAARAGEPVPRLLSGPEQDVVIRELLAGNAAGQGTSWPERLGPALPTRGFAAELRDLLMRALERGVRPDELAAWGRERGRDDWPAAGRFLQEYGDVTTLASDGAAYDPAGLVRAAVALLHADPATLDGERARLRHVYVDEYQDTDPAQEDLLALLAGDGRELVVVGDPDQAIYAFRGSTARCLLDFPDRFRRVDGRPAPTLALTTCRRSGTALLAASRRVIGQVAGPQRRDHRALTTTRADDGTVEVHVLSSASQEAALIAHRLREAHLREGIAWSRMAVLVRSTTRQLAVLRRAFLSAGVPLAVAGEELPLAEQPAATALLDLLDAALPDPGRSGWPAGFDDELALRLLASPLGGADALDLRRLRQQLRRIESSAARCLREPGELLLLPEAVAAPAQRVADLLATARQEARRPNGTVEDVLWAVWQASGLAPRWQRAARGRGPGAAAAHRDLDAVVALFEAAARFVDRLPLEGPRGFLADVRSQQIPADTLAARAPLGEAVRVLTAHASKGLEWDLVVVAGVQEGRWPDLRVRGSVLGSEQLVELAEGHEPDLLAPVPALRAEEWRLFYVAVTRARDRLLVTAVDSPDGDVPSRLPDAVDARVLEDGSRPHSAVPRLLALPALVAELRAVAADPDADVVRREQAAAELRRLSGVGVPGADPGSWWGAAPLSDDRPVRDADEAVPVSPSKVDRFGTCGVQWLLETAGGSGGPSASATVGTLVHGAAALAVEPAVTLADLQAELDRSWAGLDLGGPWYSGHQREAAREMLAKLHEWLAGNPRELVGVEREFTAAVGRARLRGRVDRLERDAAGRLVVIDLKTGGTPTQAEIARHAQLGAYQAAVEAGGFGAEDVVSGGAELVALKGTKRAAVKAQAALADGEDRDWAHELVREVADGMAAATFVATENRYCFTCAVATACPLVAPGRQVTQ